MFKRKVLIALIVPLTVVLAGCGGSDGDDVSITNNFGDGGSEPGPGPGPGPGPDGDCNRVVDAGFVQFNEDCSIGVLEGTIDSDYTLISGPQWRLSSTVTVGVIK